jgi:hypothetical protein
MNTYFVEDQNRYRLGNSFIERTWVYDGKFLHTVSLLDKTKVCEYVVKEPFENEFGYEGLTYNRKMVKDNPYHFRLKDVVKKEYPADFYTSARMEVCFHLEDPFHGVSIERCAVLYEGTSAIRTYCRVKSHNMPYGEVLFDARYNWIERIGVEYKEYDTTVYNYWTRTDRKTELIEVLNAQEGFVPGNVLLSFREKDKQGFYIIKEAPATMDERPETKGSFHFDDCGIDVLSWGIMPVEIRDDRYQKTYSAVVGVFNTDPSIGYMKIHEYLKTRFSQGGKRKYYTMINPWGDRTFYEHVSEKFILDEIDAAARIGAEQYQIDDGWQKGSRLVRVVWNEAFDFSEYWSIDESKFPEGFKNVAQRAKEKGVELCLWFAPDRNRLYRNVEEAAEILFRMYKEYDIKCFKLDAFQNRSKEAEENFEEMMRILREKSGGEITFNLDVTADARGGYFMFLEYGGIFLENRYTVFKSYFPHSTLRNLWNLSFTVPPQFLQIEYVNPLLNKDKYEDVTELAPWSYSAEYIFAVTMFANPLGWFESSGLKEETVSTYNKMLEIHKSIRKDLDKGVILPIGNRPDGYSWTGFQCVLEDSGYLLLFRENSKEDCFRYALHGIGDATLCFEELCSDGDAKFSYNQEGLEISMSKPRSFVLLKYVIQ